MVRFLSFAAGLIGKPSIKRASPPRGFLVLSALVISALALAGCQLDKTFGFQGYLTDALGNPITGTRNIEFKFWNCATGVLIYSVMCSMRKLITMWRLTVVCLM